MSADLPPPEEAARLRRDESRWLEQCRERLAAHRLPTPPQRTTTTEEDR